MGDRVILIFCYLCLCYFIGVWLKVMETQVLDDMHSQVVGTLGDDVFRLTNQIMQSRLQF